MTSGLRARALEMIEAGISRVLPFNLLRSALKFSTRTERLAVGRKRYDLSRGRLFVVGGGKASGLMAEEIEKIIGPARIADGLVNCGAGEYRTTKIKVVLAGHPVPDEAGIRGVREMLALKGRYEIGRNDLVLCLISGGGSALLPCPANGVSLQDKQDITRLLLACGANIKEINTVRKHLSLSKGGGLGRYFSPARVVSLIISDVVGDDLETIASGPTVPDRSTFNDAYNVLEKYGLSDKAPPNAVAHIESGRLGLRAETPKMLANCDNYIIGNSRMALEAMAEKARDMGMRPEIIRTDLTGDTGRAAVKIAQGIISGRYQGFDALLLGGETTPTLPALAGKGGRNQHYAAVSLFAMETYRLPWLTASVATDGSDYLPDAAGAVVDDHTLQAARAAGIDVQDYIDRYDSHTLLNRIGRCLIVTGSTGTNVSDIVLYLLA